ncbi:MAG: hypothetical protein DMG22_12635 [Acidobacteria bacterium]|nr:MAG: hypothetical protein DMG22_12635 [Acidobacteriota bacterium]
MIQQNTALFLKLYTRPKAAMSEIIDRGSWVFGAVAVALVSAMFQFGVTARLYGTFQAAPAARVASPGAGKPAAAPDEDVEEEPLPSTRRLPLPLVGNLGWRFITFSPTAVFTGLIALALLYVPLTLWLVNLFEQMGSLGVVLRRDYGALLATTLMAWAASHLPLSLLGLALGARNIGPTTALALWVASKAWFGLLMVLALRTVFGGSLVHALATVAISWVSVIFESGLALLASPFILYFGYLFLQGDVRDVLSGFSSRQSFRRSLEAATINPRDAEAHHQLGLIHLERHQLTEAAERFRRAAEIDPEELDPRYQLGCIARTQGRLEEALEHFNFVVSRDDKHSESEIWREIGATNLAASRYEEARAALERYVERREYDPEGLYYLGQAYLKLGQAEPARQLFARCVEAEKANPYRRHGRRRRWRGMAEKQLRGLR